MEFLRKFIIIVMCIMLAMPVSVFDVQRAEAALNKQINYQGKLMDTSGNPVTNGSYNIRFKLYTVPTGGSEIWTETWCYGGACNGSGTDIRVPVINGLFSVMLGSTTSLADVNFNQTLYLGVEIGGSGSTASWDGEMSPRKRLGVVPAALEADKVDGLSSEQFFRNDITNATSTATTSFSVLQTGAGDIARFIGQSGANVLTVQSTGNVGIGTTTPYAKLTVWGANTTAGVNSFLVANSASTTLFAVDNAGNSNFSVSTATTTIAGGLAVAGSAGLKVLQNGNVGINNASPSVALDVGGFINTSYIKLWRNGGSGTASEIYNNTSVTGMTTGLYFTTDNGAGGAGGVLRFFTGSQGFTVDPNAGVSTKFDYVYGGNHAYTELGSTFDVYAGTGLKTNIGAGNTKGFLTVDTTGNVGIGTSTPYAKLSVNGQVVASHFTATTTATSTLPSLAATNLQTGSARITGALYDGTNSPGVSGYVLQSTASGLTWVATSTLGLTGAESGTVGTGIAGQFPYYAAGGNVLTATSTIFVTTGSNVGIGTTTPQTKLSVAGDATVTGTLYVNALPIRNTVASSFFVGTDAGLSASAASQSNFLGTEAGSGATNASQSNFLGYGAGSGAINANDSNFLGYSAGYGAEEAEFSNFFGNGAGYGATNALHSNFFGNSAGSGAANAANSIFIGRNAGQNDTVNNTAGNASSILIGNYTGTGGFSNSIAIGQGTANSAANQLNIGGVIYATGLGAGTSPSAVPTDGNVGIGTSSPYAKLSVNGQIVGAFITATTTATSTLPSLVATNFQTGSARITGALYDSTNSPGTSGRILQTTGTGVTWVATSSLNVNAITAIGAAGQTSDGPTVTFATSADTNIGLTITGSGDTQTFTSTWTGTLADARVADNITISGGTIGSNSISGTLTTTGTLTIGDGGDRIDVNSDTWDVTNGVFTGGTWQGNVISSTYLDTAVILSTEIDTSAELAAILGDETGGAGVAVFNASPNFTGTATFASLTTTGNVGIGSSTPNAVLGVEASSTLAALTVRQSTSTTAGPVATFLSPTGELMRISNNGNVGIGTSSPSARFSIQANVSDLFTPSLFTVASSSVSSTTINFIVQSNGFVGIGTSTSVGFSGSTRLGVIGDISVGGPSATATIKSYDGGGNASQSLLITSGTTASNPSGNVMIKPADASSVPGKVLIFGGDSGFGDGSNITLQGGAGNNYGNITMQHLGGNVGIGTTSPYAKLSVNGQIVGAFITATTTATSTLPSLLATNTQTGSLRVTGMFYDGTNSPGTSGRILQTTGTGVAWVATSSLNVNAITAIGAAGQTSDGPTVTFATSADTNIGLTITGSGDTQTFTSTWTGTLADARVADAITVSGGTIGSNSISAASTWTTLGQLTIGDGGDRIDVNSDTWDVTNGVFTGGTWQGNAIASTYLDTAVILSTEIDTSAELAAILGDETGTGFAVFSDAPTFTGTTTAAGLLATNIQTTSLRLTGRLYDSANSAGTNGMVLQTSGSSATWVATSTLGFAAATQIGAGTAGQFPYYASTGSDLTATSTLFLSSSGNVGIGTTSPYAKLSVNGQVVARNFYATSTSAASYFAGTVSVGTTTNGVGTGYGLGSAVTPSLFVADLEIAAGSGDLSADPSRYALVAIGAKGQNSVGGAIAAGALGSNIYIAAGNGGDASSGSFSNFGGSGGNITLKPGSGGTGADGNGTNGSVFLNGNTAVGFTSASGYRFYVRGGGGVNNPFAIASSTGTVQMTVDRFGNLGIGSSTPNAVLGVEASSTLAALTVRQSTSTTAGPVATFLSPTEELMRLTNTGNLGIGTSSPYAKLSVNGQTVAAYFTATTTATSTLPSLLATDLQTTSFRVSGRFYDSANSAGTNGMVLQTSGTTATWVATSTLGFAAATQIGAGTAGQFPYYASAGSTLTATSTLFLSTAGFIGIGTPSPDRALQVNGSVRANGYYADAAGAASSPAFRMVSGGGTLGMYTANTDTLGFATAGTERVVIGSTGSLGVGTSSPFGLLSINPSGISGPAFVIGSSTATTFAVTNTGATQIAATHNLDSSVVRLFGLSTSNTVAFTSALMHVAANTPISWSNDANNAQQTKDVGLARNAAGILRVTDGSTGFGTLIAGNMGVGTTSPWAKFSIAGAAGATGNLFTISTSTAASATTTAVLINSNGFATFSGGLDSRSAPGVTNLTLGTPTFAGTGNVGIGIGVTVAQNNSVVIGNNASGWGDDVVIGEGATAVNSASNFGRIVIGRNSIATSTNTIAIGRVNAISSGIGIGSSLTTTGHRAVILGESFTNTTAGFVGLGYGNALGGDQNGEMNIGLTIQGAFNIQTPLISVTASNASAARKQFGFQGLWSDAVDGTRVGAVNIGAYRGSTFTSGLLVSAGTTTPYVYVPGNIGIGSTTPNALLAIEASSTLAALTVRQSTSTTAGPVFTFLSPTEELMRLTNTGNLGIGTSSPYAKLSVNGLIVGSHFVGTTTATSSLAGDLMFGSGRIIGIPSGNFAIRTTSAGSGGSILLETADAGGTAGSLSMIAGDGATGGSITLAAGAGIGNGTVSISTQGSGSISLTSGSTGSLLLNGTAGGNVGIGTTSPYAKLSVNGQTVAAYFTATTTATSTLPSLLATDLQTTSFRVSGRFYDSTNSSGTNGMVLLSTGSATTWVATSSLGISGGSGGVGAGTTGQFPYYAADGSTLTATSSLFISTAGNIGIGTTSPAQKLSVSGTSLFSASSTLYGLILPTLSIWDTGVNPIMKAQASFPDTSGYNTTLGYQAGASTTPYFDVDSNVGSYNTFLGYRAGFANSTGNSNTAIGYQAGVLMNGGAGNVVIGNSAASALTGGGSNIIIGNQAGGTLSSGSNNIIIGTSLAVATSSGASNYINIGSTVFGNSVQKTFGIGSTSPQSRFVVHSDNAFGSFMPRLFSVASSTLETGTGTTSTHFMVLANGNVGVGTSSPLARLSVHAGMDVTYQDNLFLVASSTPSSVLTHLVVKANGNVGIGTTSPFAKLSVKGAGNGTGVLAAFTDSNDVARATFLDNGFFMSGTTTASGRFTIAGTTDNGLLGLVMVSGQASNPIEIKTHQLANVAYMTSAGDWAASSFGHIGGIYSLNGSRGLQMGTNVGVEWAASAGYGTYDVALYRSGSSALQIYSASGGSGALRLATTTWSNPANSTVNAIYDAFNGRFGIGTTTPTAMLGIRNTSSSNSFAVEDVANDSSPFVIDSDGKVGIGSTTPYATLGITAPSPTTFTNALHALYVRGATGVFEDITFGGYKGGPISLIGGVGGGGAANDAIGPGGIGGEINLTGGAGGSLTDNCAFCFDLVAGAGGNVTISGGTGGSASGGSLNQGGNGGSIYLMPGIGGTGSDANGSAGSLVIGTTTNDGWFTYQSKGVSTQKALSIINESGARILSLQDNGKLGLGSTTPWGMVSISATSSLGTAPLFVIGSSTATQFIVTSTGSVGIGTTSPYAKLSVNGQAVASHYAATTTSQNTFGGDVLIGAPGASSRFMIGQATSSLAYPHVYGGMWVGQSSPSYDNYTFLGSASDTFAGGNPSTFFNAPSSSGNMFFRQNNVTWAHLNSTSFSFALNNDNANYGITNALTVINLTGNSGTVNNIGLVIKARASQAGNLMQWQNSSDSILGVINATGRMGIGTTTPAGILSVNALGGFPSLIVGSSTNTHLVLTDAGNLGIGTSSPQQRLHVYRNSDGAPIRVEDTNGYCEINPTSTTWTCTSDRRLKKNIESLDSEQVLTAFKDLRSVRFNWNKESDNDPTHIGFIAQEVEELFPDLVTTDEKGMKTVAYGSFIPYMVQVMQEQQKQIEDLRTLMQEPVITDTFITLVVDKVKTALGFRTNENSQLTGVTIYDEATGDPFCLKVRNGQMVTSIGTCSASSTPPVVPEYVNNPGAPVPIANGTSTASTSQAIITALDGTVGGTSSTSGNGVANNGGNTGGSTGGNSGGSSGPAEPPAEPEPEPEAPEEPSEPEPEPEPEPQPEPEPAPEPAPAEPPAA